MENENHIDIIKDCYLKNKSLSDSDLQKKIPRRKRFLENLSGKVNFFKDNDLTNAWKTVFMVCASIEANSSSFFRLDFFLKYGPYLREEFVQPLGLPYKSNIYGLGKEELDSLYKGVRLADWGMSLPNQIDPSSFLKTFGVKKTESELEELARTGRALAGEADPMSWPTMRRFKNFPYPEGWREFFLEVWEILSYEKNFKRCSELLLLHKDTSGPFVRDYWFDIGVLKCTDLESVFRKDSMFTVKDSMFTVDGCSFMESPEAISLAKNCLVSLERHETDKEELTIAKLELKTLEHMAISDADFLSFFEDVIRFHEKRKASVDLVANAFLASLLR